MSPTPNAGHVEALEIRLLLEACSAAMVLTSGITLILLSHAGFGKASAPNACTALAELQPCCSTIRAMERFLLSITVNVTSMFRDPSFYRAFRAYVRARVAPRQLFFRSGTVGCSTGEEVYSMAILPPGRRSLRALPDLCHRHERRGPGPGQGRYLSSGSPAGLHPAIISRRVPELIVGILTRPLRTVFIFHHSLSENVVLPSIILVTDASFNEFHVILCS